MGRLRSSADRVFWATSAACVLVLVFPPCHYYGGDWEPPGANWIFISALFRDTNRWDPNWSMIQLEAVSIGMAALSAAVMLSRRNRSITHGNLIASWIGHAKSKTRNTTEERLEIDR
jgi:hypothetical protein